MKIIRISFLLISSIIYGQESNLANIFSDEFHLRAERVFVDQKNNIVFFTPFYSVEKLKERQILINDSTFYNNMQFVPQKHKYYLRQTYRKDNIEGTYNQTEAVVKEKIDIEKLKELDFKRLPKEKTVYECQNQVYDDIITMKLFDNTGVIITSKNLIEINVSMIAEDCYVADSEKYYYKDTLYSLSNNFICLKIRDYYILYYTKD